MTSHIPAEVKGGFGPGPSANGCAERTGIRWESVVSVELQDSAAIFNTFRPLWILTVQDVAKGLAELWGKHPVGL